MNDPTEAVITINGRQLTYGESMTIRVALESFAWSLTDDGLGEDETGKAITKGYQANIRTIREKMYVRELSKKTENV